VRIERLQVGDCRVVWLSGGFDWMKRFEKDLKSKGMALWLS